MRLKTVLVVGLTCLFVGVLGTVLYIDREDPRRKEIQRLQEVVSRLQSERRVAQVVVLRQWKDPSSGRLKTEFRFTENTPQGDSLESHDFTIDGDVAYFDALVVKFDHKYVELGDALRGKSLYLFRRVFGESQAPEKGFPLDPHTPAAYRLKPSPSTFEQEIWSEFWRYAVDSGYAASKGVRVAFGEAVYTRLVPGKVYRLTIENAGGLNLKSEDLSPAR